MLFLHISVSMHTPTPSHPDHGKTRALFLARTTLFPDERPPDCLEIAHVHHRHFLPKLKLELGKMSRDLISQMWRRGRSVGLAE